MFGARRGAIASAVQLASGPPPVSYLFFEDFNSYSLGTTGRDEFYARSDVTAGTVNDGFVVDAAGKTGNAFKIGAATTRRLIGWTTAVPSPTTLLSYRFSYYQNSSPAAADRSHMVIASTDTIVTGLSVGFGPNRTVVVYRNNTTLVGASASDAISDATWNDIEVDLDYNPGAFEVEVIIRANGIEVFNVPNVPLSGATLVGIGMRSKESSFTGVDQFYDDVGILDLS